MTGIRPLALPRCPPAARISPPAHRLGAGRRRGGSERPSESDADGPGAGRVRRGDRATGPRLGSAFDHKPHDQNDTAVRVDTIVPAPRTEVRRRSRTGGHTLRGVLAVGMAPPEQRSVTRAGSPATVTAPDRHVTQAPNISHLGRGKRISLARYRQLGFDPGSTAVVEARLTRCRAWRRLTAPRRSSSVGSDFSMPAPTAGSGRRRCCCCP